MRSMKVKTQDRNFDFARKVRAKQPDSLEGRTDVIGRLSLTIARSLSMKPFSGLLLHDRSVEGLEILALID
jgi:hypothetical protein